MNKKIFSQKARYAWTVLGSLTLSIAASDASTWTGDTDENYNDPTNWDDGVPDATDIVFLEGGGTGVTTLTGGVTNDAVALNVRGGHVFNIDNDGGTLSTSANVNVGRGVAGDGSTINHSAGVFAIGGLDMGGNTTGGTSAYTLSGTASLTVDNAGSNRDFDIGGDDAEDFGATFIIQGDGPTLTLNATPILLRSSASLNFTLGATSIDAIDTTGNFTLQAGGELVIDGSSYTGGAATIPLFVYGSRADETEFAETVSGFDGFDTDIVYNEGGIDLVITEASGELQITSFTADVLQTVASVPVTLSWTTLNATTLTLNPGGIDVTGLTSSMVNPAVTTEYILTASDGVTSIDSDPIEIIVVPEIVSFAADFQQVTANQPFTLSWEVEGATTLTLDPGNIDVTGLTSEEITDGITEDTLYTLTASDGISIVSAEFPIALVEELPVIVGSPIISVNFHADDVDALAEHEITSGEVAGFIPIDGQFWTNINIGAPGPRGVEPIFPSTTLTDNSGNSNAATIAPSVDSSVFVGYAASAAGTAAELGLSGNDDDLFNSYLALNGPNGDGSPADAAVLNISGLSSAFTNGGYTLIIYSDSDRRGPDTTRQSFFTLTPNGESPLTSLVEDDFTEANPNTFSGSYFFSDGEDDGADYANFTIFEGLSAESFSLEVTSPGGGGRGAISGFQIVGGTGLINSDSLVLCIENATNGTDLNFSWESLPGMVYTLRANTSLEIPPSTWPVVLGQENVAATPPMNNVTIVRPVDPTTFYIVEENPAP